MTTDNKQIKLIQYKHGKSRNIKIDSLEGLEFSHTTDKGKWYRDCGLGVYFIKHEGVI